jgi:hypothetical protein
VVAVAAAPAQAGIAPVRAQLPPLRHQLQGPKVAVAATRHDPVKLPLPWQLLQSVPAGDPTFGSITFWKTRPGKENARQRHSPTNKSDTNMKISLIIYPITQREDASKHNKLH